MEKAWQLAREIACKVYGLTKKANFDSDFGLRGQIQDAAGSSIRFIPARGGTGLQARSKKP
ncbi:MAG: four helix bundle protein [Desulfosarcina sp.]|nr:four helix bundle protein [Desulfosarcina sp.]MBC2764924.1 four helix bundle protein [Desulfosarcina sp.]